MIGTGQVRVAIVDSYQLLVDALQMVILMQEDMTMVGTGSTCTECLDLVRHTTPQVLLLEGRLLAKEGVALAQAIRTYSPDTNILMLTTASDEEWLLQAMLSWVCGCISRHQNLAEVLKAIRQAAPGKPATAVERQFAEMSRALPLYTGNGKEMLTRREGEVLALLARGKTVKEIAGLLTIAPLTVRTHIRNLLQKMGCRSQLQAVAYGYTNGLIERA